MTVLSRIAVAAIALGFAAAPAFAETTAPVHVVVVHHPVHHVVHVTHHVVRRAKVIVAPAPVAPPAVSTKP